MRLQAARERVGGAGLTEECIEAALHKPLGLREGEAVQKVQDHVVADAELGLQRLRPSGDDLQGNLCILISVLQNDALACTHVGTSTCKPSSGRRPHFSPGAQTRLRTGCI